MEQHEDTLESKSRGRQPEGEDGGGGKDVERNISVKEFRLLDNGDSRTATMATTPP